MQYRYKKGARKSKGNSPFPVSRQSNAVPDDGKFTPKQYASITDAFKDQNWFNSKSEVTKRGKTITIRFYAPLPLKGDFITRGHVKMVAETSSKRKMTFPTVKRHKDYILFKFSPE